MSVALSSTEAFEGQVIIAHRGASVVAPENTEVAIRKALRLSLIHI